MDTIRFSDAWHNTFSGGHVGLLALAPVDNRRRPTLLDDHKQALEADMRAKHGAMNRAELRQLLRGRGDTFPGPQLA